MSERLMKTMRILRDFGRAFLAGVAISIGGSVYLSVENRVAGALLFTVGLFMVVVNGLLLYTGKVGYLVLEREKRSYLGLLGLTWLGNLAGSLFTGGILRLTRVCGQLASSGIGEKAAQLSRTKLEDSPWSILILSFFCGVLMFMAVDGYRNIPHSAGKCAALFLGVSVFILAGFEHCVANMFYFTLAGAWSAKAVAWLLLMTLGNSLGGMAVPLLAGRMSGRRERQPAEAVREEESPALKVEVEQH